MYNLGIKSHVYLTEHSGLTLSPYPSQVSITRFRSSYNVRHRYTRAVGMTPFFLPNLPISAANLSTLHPDQISIFNYSLVVDSLSTTRHSP